MTVWPMETVFAVGRLRVMGYESREVYARFIDDARRLLRERLARSLVDAARTHGVEIDPRDVMVEVAIPEESAWTRKFEASWQPQTTIVKLVGGPKDGSVMDVKGRTNQRDPGASHYGRSVLGRSTPVAASGRDLRVHRLV